MNAKTENLNEIHIRPANGWQLINLKELSEYRDLFYFLVWRDIKALYAQTILGFSWAVLAPLIQIVIFTIIFGKVAKLDTDGIPYFLYSTVAIIPWAYMSNALSSSSQSLVGNSSMLGKIYFPRLIYPLIPILSKMVDFVISLTILIAVMIYYMVTPEYNFTLGSNLFYLPIFLMMMMVVPAAIGMWLSALAIRYRDVKFAMQFIIRLLIYTAPILYSATDISEKYGEGYRILYSLNPIVGVIEGYRACLLNLPMPWEYILPGMFTATILLLLGAFYFRRMEHVFVDVI